MSTTVDRNFAFDYNYDVALALIDEETSTPAPVQTDTTQGII
jgi:hypothetical protein